MDSNSGKTDLSPLSSKSVSQAQQVLSELRVLSAKLGGSADPMSSLFSKEQSEYDQAFARNLDRLRKEGGGR